MPGATDEAAPTAAPAQRAGKAAAAPIATATPVAAAADDLEEGAGWTILIYTQVNEESALAAIHQMEATGPPAETNVIVQVDGSAAGGATRRYLLAADGDPAILDSTLLAESEAGESSTAGEIASFVAWAGETYPTTRLALWLWNVGAETLSLAELLAAAPAGERLLALLAWDWPLAGDLTTLAALQPLARLALVPETALAGQGWDYAAALAALGDAAPAGGPELAALLAEQLAPAGGPPVALIDLQALPAATSALAALSAALQAEPGLNAGAVAGARAAAQLAMPSDPASGAGLPLVSLGRFTAELTQRSPDPLVAAAAGRLGEALAALAPSTDAITISFPPADGALDAAYAAVAPAGWADFLGSYDEATTTVPAPSLALLPLADAAGGARLPVFAAFELSGRQIESVRLAAWRLEEDGDRLVSTAFLAPPQSDGEAAALHWPDGVHEGHTIWDARAAYLSDGEAGEFVALWPLALGSSDLLAPGRLETEDGAVVEQAALHFDGASGSLQATWDLAATPPRLLAPGPDARFSPTVFRQGSTGELAREAGAAIRFGENGPAYSLQPLPVGDYRLQLTAATAGGAATAATADIAVNNEGYDGATYTYLDPYHGFQFALPVGWAPPRYEDGRLVSANADGATTLALSLTPATGRRTSELRALTLEQFGAVSTVFAESRPVADSRGELVAYAYEGDDGPHTGVFIAFIAGENGYVVDVDGPASAEAETLAVLEQIAASWLSRPLGLSRTPRSWREIETPAFTVPVPQGFGHQSLANGWELFSDEGRFVALRREAATGQSRAARVQHWLDVAGEGVAAFAQEPLYQFGLGSRGWVRADFIYEREGQPVQGLVMTTVADGEEIAAWIEAPAGQGDAFIDPVALALVAQATGSPAAERLLYQASFAAPGGWGAGQQEGARGEVADGVYRLEVAAPEGFFWTAAGQSFGDGVYEVTATQVAGPLDNGYGLLLRAAPESAAFYVLAVSGDGYIWIGQCRDSCAAQTTLAGDGWFAHAAVNQGLGAPNRLRAVAAGDELQFFVNGEPVGAASGLTLLSGDVGLFVETLGQGGVSVAFDDVRVYAP